MHTDVRSETPGNCPKCGMTLVDAASVPAAPSTLRQYAPLITVIGLILTVSAVASLHDLLYGGFSAAKAIGYFMAGFFVVFAGFKLMDLKGFAEGYASYDLLAKRARVYGLLYPFIELAFGLSMLAGIRSPVLLWAEFALMAFSGAGVLVKLLKKEKFQCACLGTFFKVPLTSVTLVEDFGMAALALTLLFIFF